MPTTTDGTEPLIVRPRRARVVAVVAAAVVVVLFSLIAASLKSEAVFSTGDQAAMVGLGVMLAAGVLTFTRPSLHADASGLRIRNVIGGYELPWEVVRSLRFDHGAAWASLELVDDDLVPVMAIQRADKERAVAAARALRGLLERYGPAAAARPAEVGADPAGAGTDEAEVGAHRRLG